VSARVPTAATRRIHRVACNDQALASRAVGLYGSRRDRWLGAPRTSLLSLQRTAGNAAVAQLLQGQRPGEDIDTSPVLDVVGKGKGRPLDSRLRSDMEALFGQDFSQVRVHTGPQAAASASSVSAEAYTVGDEIVFGEGRFSRRTLAHELTHVVQQRAGPVSGVDTGRGVAVSEPSDRFEQEAQATAHRVMSGSVPAVSVGAAARGGVQRACGCAPGATCSCGPEHLALQRETGQNPEDENDNPFAAIDPKDMVDSMLPEDVAELGGQAYQQPSTAEAPVVQPLFLQRSGNGAKKCPTYASYDTGQDLNNYNCAGLSERTYVDTSLAATKAYLAGATSVAGGTACGAVGTIKHWLWEYDLHFETVDGRATTPQPDFHTIAGPTDGNPTPTDSSDYYSKNGHRKVYGPDAPTAFKPPAREIATASEPAERQLVDSQGRPIYKVRTNMKETCFCLPCPKKP
jgi:Domain of unknown function (DUF4157)